LSTLREFSKEWYELIVIDNASPIKIDYKADILIQNKRNLGNSRAWNQGLKLATGDYLLLADNDVEFSLGWERMAGKDSITFPLSKCGRQEDYVQQLAGYFWMMSRQTFEKLGYISEKYGLGYYEDTDYFMTAQQKGVPLVCYNEVKIYHHGRATSSKMDIMEDFVVKNKKLYETKFNGEYPKLSN
jgi:GT2 family glycosyltransferase